MTKSWPATTVTLWTLDKLKPYAGNARTHSPAQVAQIADSIDEWGFTNPILAEPNGTIIAGHGRFMAAERLGLAEVPVMVATGWTPEQVRAYVLADNKLAENAGWDEELLRLEIGSLNDAGFDLGLAGFSEEALAGLLAAKDDTAPAAPSLKLAERFGIPPFSVMNAREGWWQDRKAAWLAIGIESEVGRGENLLKFSDTINEPDPAKRKAKAKTFHDGARLGAGGLADPVAAAATARAAKKASNAQT